LFKGALRYLKRFEKTGPKYGLDSTKDQELHTNIGFSLLELEVDLSKYNDAKPSDKSDDEGQPPLKRPKLTASAAWHSQYYGSDRMIGPIWGAKQWRLFWKNFKLSNNLTVKNYSFLSFSALSEWWNHFY
jgi:hypothetical protein